MREAKIATLAFLEGTMDTATLRKKVAEIGFWYHRIHLPGGCDNARGESAVHGCVSGPA
jgi:hypothetical protein